MACQIRKLFGSFEGLELQIPGGGVGVYVWQTYKVMLLGDLSYISDNDLHQLSINRQLSNLKSIVSCTIYRPLDCPLTSRFDTDLAAKVVETLFGKDDFRYLSISSILFASSVKSLIPPGPPI